MPVDRREHRSDPRLIKTEGAEVMEPEVPVTQPHVEILFREPEGAQALHQERDQLDLRLRTWLAEDVRVELEEASSTPLLHPFIAEELADAEPLDRPPQRVGARANQPADGRGHLGPQRHFTPTLVGETEKLRLDLVTRLGLVQFQRLQHGRVVLREPKAGCRLAPQPENVAPPG